MKGVLAVVPEDTAISLADGLDQLQDLHPANRAHEVAPVVGPRDVILVHVCECPGQRPVRPVLVRRALVAVDGAAGGVEEAHACVANVLVQVTASRETDHHREMDGAVVAVEVGVVPPCENDHRAFGVSGGNGIGSGNTGCNTGCGGGGGGDRCLGYVVVCGAT